MSMNKQATTIVPIHDLIASRWSGRAFDPAKNISEETLLALLEASRWAPSCYGDQPWHFIIFNRAEDEAAWKTAQATLVEKNHQWAQHAPVLILATAARTFRGNGKPNQWAEYDTGAAVMSLSLQATSMGLMTHQIGGYDSDAARKAFNVPADVQLLAMIAVGYPGSLENLDENFQQLETRPRQRNALEQHFYTGRWGKSIREAK